MTVRVFRLTTGEDIIGDVEIDQHGYHFTSPAAIVIQQTQDGRVGASFVPFAPFAKKVTLYASTIAGEMEVDTKLVNQYNSIFGSGIVVAAANEMPSILTN